MEIKPLNPMPDGTCRTIKSQYQNSSMANFIRKGSMAATEVIEYESEGSRSDMEKQAERNGL